MKWSHAAAWRTAGLSLMLACVGLTHAASLQVAPTLVAFEPGSKGQALWLSNTGEDAPVRTQVRVYRWTQHNGEEILEPTTDLVVSPPLAELNPDARQLVRIIRTSPMPTDVETSYRLVVDEVPPADSLAHNGLRLLMRYSVPVFVLPDTKVPPTYQLSSTLEQRDGQTNLVVRNDGGQHAQLADLALLGPDGTRQVLLPGLVGYILPHQTMRWPLPASSGSLTARGRLQARINAEADEHVLIDDLAQR